MILAAAQIRSLPGDVETNVAAHLHWIDLAAESGAGLVLFPELSLTGYEPRLAYGLKMEADDARLDVFQDAADRHEMVIAVGAPLLQGKGVGIGMVIFQPEKPRMPYVKQRLHNDELPFFTAGSTDVLFRLEGRAFAPAICYESLKASHAGSASRRGATVYLASVAKSATGVAKTETHYPSIARRFGLTVLMANAVGPCDDFEAAGASAAWNASGMMAGPMPADGEGLLVVALP